LFFTDEKDYTKAWQFVEEEYYCISLRDDPVTRQHLEKAKEDLLKLVNNHNSGSKFRRATLGRVMYILGDPITEVLECFDTAISKAEDPKDKIIAYQQYGLFYEILGPRRPEYPKALDDANRYHTMAINFYNRNQENARRPFIAYNGKRCLKDKQLYRQTQGW